MRSDAVPLGRTGYGTTGRGDRRRCAAESCDVIIRLNQAYSPYCPCDVIIRLNQAYSPYYPCHCRDRVSCRRQDHRMFAPGGETVPAAIPPGKPTYYRPPGASRSIMFQRQCLGVPSTLIRGRRIPYAWNNRILIRGLTTGFSSPIRRDADVSSAGTFRE